MRSAAWLARRLLLSSVRCGMPNDPLPGIRSVSRRVVRLEHRWTGIDAPLEARRCTWTREVRGRGGTNTNTGRCVFVLAPIRSEK